MMTILSKYFPNGGFWVYISVCNPRRYPEHWYLRMELLWFYNREGVYRDGTIDEKVTVISSVVHKYIPSQDGG